ncbi:MAG: GNAT family N-acetyltransferase [Gammaproteobacteria bacterium]
MTCMAGDIEQRHFWQWRDAYCQYAAFYRCAINDAQLRRLWQWLTCEPPQVFGIVAESGGELWGIAHWRVHPHPLAGRMTAYLDDLFVLPDRRGIGIGKMLTEECALRASKSGCNRLRWATAKDNFNAQKLYDKIAKRTGWLIYDLDIAPDIGAGEGAKNQ